MTTTASRRTFGRGWVFAGVTASCVAAVAVYGLQVRQRLKTEAGEAAAVATQPLTALPEGRPEGTAMAPPRHLLFRSTALGPTLGRIGLARLDRPGEVRAIGELDCDRVYAAAGVGVCLQAHRGAVTSYEALVLDAKLQVRHRVALAGSPSRARVSPDGRSVAFTVFVTGHSYSAAGFTTRTSVLDAETGQWRIADLESMTVERDGRPFKAADFNFWGVSFAPDSRRFVATLGTGGRTLLVEGDLHGDRLRVIHDDVECPSWSPDGRHVAFKRRASPDAAGRRPWRLVVLDLDSGRETRLDRETRNVDDQVEWLGPDRIAYALPREGEAASVATDVWALAADGSGDPQRVLPYAYSPAALP